jgi:hypothetical protein
MGDASSRQLSLALTKRKPYYSCRLRCGGDVMILGLSLQAVAFAPILGRPLIM